MIPTPLVLAAGTVVLVVALAITGWSLFPQVADATWLVMAAFLSAFWGALEASKWGKSGRATEGAVRAYRLITVWIGLVIAVAFASQLAVGAGLLGAESLPLARRVRGILFGIGLVIAGNYLPKLVSPWKVDEEPFDWQRVHRFVGWLGVLCGAAFVLVWLSLPPAAASRASAVITVVFVGLAVGRKLVSLRAYARG